jgi:cyclopropane fatty-acyl-phospholipid synthase-like methyltransferase
MTALPFAPACERNRAPILACIGPLFLDARRVLEIGSGTGQHAAWFAPRLPHLQWITSDLRANHAAIRAWIEHSGAQNIAGPLELDTLRQPWPELTGVDAAFSANTAHIMPEEAVSAMFEGLATVLGPGAPFCLYGPFMEQGRHTSDSNRRFDEALRAEDPGMGVRDLGWLLQVAALAGFELEAVEPMPANNRVLVWRRN